LSEQVITITNLCQLYTFKEHIFILFSIGT